MYKVRLIWVLRVVWVLAPAALAPALLSATENFSPAILRATFIGLLSFWGAMMIAVWIPHRASLTGFRIFAPAGLAVAFWAGIDSGDALALTLAMAQMLIVNLVGFSALLGNEFISAEACGEEKRLLLKPPAIIKYALAPLWWTIGLAGFFTGPLLMAHERWLLGTILTAIGLIVFSLAVRSLFSLACRQLIFLNNAIILTDPLNLKYPLHLEQAHIKSFSQVGTAFEVELMHPIQIIRKNKPNLYRRLQISTSLPGLTLKTYQER